jgi:hypothetical protein
MGTDTKILLPPGTRLDDVVCVLGKLLGLPHEKRALSDVSDSYYYRVPGIDATGAGSSATLAIIKWAGSPIPVESVGRSVLYHFEGGPHGERLLMPHCCEEWQEIGRQLVTFFGGTVDYNDCDDVDVDFSRPNQFPNGMPDGGPAWNAFQERIAAVRMIRVGNACPDCGGDPAALCCTGASA